MKSHVREYVLIKSTNIERSALQVWNAVTDFECIDYEMYPFMRMTRPDGLRNSSIADVTPGTRVGKSVLLLFGILPFSVADVTFSEVLPGRRFREESDVSGMQIWVHQRTVQSAGQHTILTDEIALMPSGLLSHIPAWGKVMKSTLSAFFAYRHRRLRRHFSLTDAPAND